MPDKKNIIRKESLNFQYNGNADGIVLQQEVTDWCRTVLNPSIENLLNDYEETGEVIYIDTLQLNTDIDGITDWKNALKEKIIYQLKEKIHSKITGKGDDVTTKSLPEKFYETLIFFLKHGILPWHSDIKTKTDFEIELSKWLKNESPSAIINFLSNFHDEKAALRFANLLNEQDFKIFIAVIFDSEQKNISTIYEDIKIITGFISGNKRLQLILLKHFNEMVISGLAIVPLTDAISQSLEQWLLNIEQNYPGQIQKINLEAITHIDIKKIIRKIQKDAVAKPKKKQQQTDDKAGEIVADNLLNKDADKDNTELRKDLADGIFISNAGAVIIAPFLTSLFLRTGLLHENNITDAGTALCLLHYCITGHTNPAEFELFFPKILCGVKPETVIDISEAIDEKFLKEADEMLASVIEYWSILKDTSINGLREAFLQRSGKLSFVKDEWLLQVEQKPYDMLLQQLPWNINMIKLPWMQHLVKTEWV